MTLTTLLRGTAAGLAALVVGSEAVGCATTTTNVVETEETRSGLAGIDNLNYNLRLLYQSIISDARTNKVRVPSHSPELVFSYDVLHGEELTLYRVDVERLDVKDKQSAAVMTVYLAAPNDKNGLDGLEPTTKSQMHIKFPDFYGAFTFMHEGKLGSGSVSWSSEKASRTWKRDLPTFDDIVKDALDIYAGHRAKFIP